MWIKGKPGCRGGTHFFFQQMTVEIDEKNKLVEHLQEKVSSLEKRLERNLSGDEHVQELLKEVLLILQSYLKKVIARILSRCVTFGRSMQ